MEFFKCGHIMTTHGLRGDLKVKNLSDFDRFVKGNRLYILHKGDYQEVIVKKANPFGDYLLVCFEGYEDINLVQKFHSEDIYISSEDRKSDELARGEDYHSDLIGMKVLNTLGEDRGVVTGIRELPQADCLEIDYNGKKCFVLFMDQFIDNVIDNKIIVKEIEGLF